MLQEFESLENKPIAWAALTAVERAIAGGTVEDTRQMAASLERVVIPMAKKEGSEDVLRS